MLLGAYCWGILGDKRGRKFSYLAMVLFTGIFGLLSAVAPSYPLLLASRGLVGFGIGGAPIAFSLLAEFLPANKRCVCTITPG